MEEAATVVGMVPSPMGGSLWAQVVPYHKEMVDGMSIAPMLALAARRKPMVGAISWRYRAR